MTRALVVDDEAQIRRAMRTSLSAHGFDVLTVGTGEEAVVAVAEKTPDLVLLDLGLPDLDGTEVIRRLRSFSDVPIIVLSVRDRQADKVAALDAGADDYVTKPFGVDEVLARARAALRRSHIGEPSAPLLSFGAIAVHLGRQLVRRGGEAIHLTRTEYQLLEAFVTNPGKLLTHQWLLRKVWGARLLGGEPLPPCLRSFAPPQARRRRLGAVADPHGARRRLPLDRAPV